MKLSTLKLVLASLAVCSLAIAGCAADTSEPSGDDVEDTEVSADELSARSAQFVGTFDWRGADSGELVDFEHLTLKADGTYDAKVESGLVNPAVRCIRFPCTLPESGKWTTVKSGGKLKIKVDPSTKSKPTRSYYADINALSRALTLTRASHTTVLFTTASTCANVRCTSSTHCEMKGLNGGAAVPVCVQNPPPAPAACAPSGCSGQICADTSMITTCEFRPEYGCYRSATCERQANGHCGWTPSAALTQCLANAHF